MFTDLGNSVKLKQDKLKGSYSQKHHRQTDETRDKHIEGSYRKVTHYIQGSNVQNDWIYHQKQQRPEESETVTLSTERNKPSISNSMSSENIHQERRQNKYIFFRGRKAGRIHGQPNCFIRNAEENFRMKGSSGIKEE